MRADRATLAVNIFTALMALSIVAALAGLAWHLFGAFAEPAAPTAATAGAPQDLDIGPALALAPFGRADVSSAPPTSLPLQLRGVVLAVPHERSTALIAPNGGIPVAYAPGQAIPGGGTVEDIAIDRVLLRVNGRLERLDLPRVSTATASPSPSGLSQSPPPPLPNGGTPISTPSAPPPRPIASLFESLPATPGPGGYHVGTPLSPVARQGGLQSGDVIERINGVSVDSISADRAQLASLMSSGYAQFAINRAGRRLSLSFPFR